MRISGGEELPRHLQLLVDLLEVYVAPADGLAADRVVRVGHALVGLRLEQDRLRLVGDGAGEARLAVEVGLVGEVLVGEVLEDLANHLRRRIHGSGEVARRDVGDGLVGLVLEGSRLRGLRLLLQPVQLFGHLADGELGEFDNAIFVGGEPLSQLLAADPLGGLGLAEPLDEQHQRSAVIIVLLQLGQAVLQLFVLELVVGLVEAAGVGERGSVETGQPDREGLIECKIGGFFEFAVADILEFLGGCMVRELQR